MHLLKMGQAVKEEWTLVVPEFTQQIKLAKTVLEDGELEPWWFQDINVQKRDNFASFRNSYLSQINSKNPNSHTLLTICLSLFSSAKQESEEIKEYLLELVCKYFSKQPIPLHISQEKKGSMSSLNELKRALKSTMHLLVLELCLAKESETAKVCQLIKFFTKIFELKVTHSLDTKIQLFLINRVIFPYLKIPSSESTPEKIKIRNQLLSLLSAIYKTKLKIVDSSHISAFLTSYTNSKLKLEREELQGIIKVS